MDIEANIEKAVELYEKTRQKLSDEMKTHLEKVYKFIFEKYPEVKRFSWDQYTPYFNDGETCVFEANSYSLSINGYNQYHESDESAGDEDALVNPFTGCSRTNYDLELGRRVENPLFNQRHSDIVESINCIFKIPDDVFLDAYGDHCNVTVYPDSVEVEEYEDHD